jgi:hypothetical protein
MARHWDPRLYQIATLGGLLGYGIWWLDLEIQPQTVATIMSSALATQLACTRLTGRGRFDPRSALISGLSLCLLLRTGSPGSGHARRRSPSPASSRSAYAASTSSTRPTSALVALDARRAGRAGVARTVGQRSRLPRFCSRQRAGSS